MSDTVLELVGVDHRYGRRRSLRQVSLTVRRGDCYGFLGHNGAGKTTALRLALGLERPTRGRVLVHGFDIRKHPREAHARTGGMIEMTGFYPWESGRKNLIALARLQGMTGRAAVLEADRLLDEVGLEEHGRRRVGAYSQGMRQRLGLAQAMLGEPPLVLLDEPQNGLDPEGIADLRAVLQRLTDTHGVTVMLSSHQLHEVTGLCNRIGILHQGELLLEDATAALLATTRDRYELTTTNDEATVATLERLGVAHSAPEQHARRIELGRVPPAELVRALVGDGVGVKQLTPRPTTLEEIYLQRTRAGSKPSDAAATSTPPARPDALRAPPWPVLRMFGYELRRHGRRWPVAIMLAVPAFLAWRRIHVLATDHARHLGEVESGQLFSTSTVTGFEAVGRGITAGIPALTVVATALASQSIAGDLSLGTLRNILLRPLRRSQVALGKAAAVAVGVAVSLAAIAITAVVSAAGHFEFGDRYEITRDGPQDLWIEAIDVWPYFSEALWGPLLPLLAYAALGFLIGTVVRRAIWALGLSLTAVLVLDLGRAVARPLGWEQWLPSAYLSSPLGDTSYLAFYLDLSIGSAEAFFDYEDTAMWTPAAWCVVPLALSMIVLARKRVA